MSSAQRLLKKPSRAPEDPGARGRETGVYRGVHEDCEPPSNAGMPSAAGFSTVSQPNGWTGGQYSLFRMIFGSYLCIHFLQLLPWGTELFSNQGALPEATASPLLYAFPNVFAVSDSPLFVTALLSIACVLSGLLAVGAYDRWAAVGLWYVWACVFGRNPLIANPSLPFIGWLLLAHACLPTAPYGSWAGRGRSDPAGEWGLPQAIYLAAWAIMALGYSYSGYTKLISPSWLDGTALARVLENPLARPGFVRELILDLPVGALQLATWGALGLELAFAPLALLRRLRPWLWGGMLAMHLGLIVVIDFADLSLGMLMLHVFTFDPAWLPPRKATATEIVFYDGQCGLCHRVVRFVLAEDRGGAAFRFAPLDSQAFRAVLSAAEREQLPDSLVVRLVDGGLLLKSAAALHILSRLGGLWRVVGALISVVPVGIRDSVYDGIARIRHSLFRPPAEACPLIPPKLQRRFEV